MVSTLDSHKAYWNDYDGLQRSKHRVLKRYLGGWYPILASSNERILYLDTHAGRGRHKYGEEGSPLVAVNTLINHQYKDKILRNAEVNFILFEIDERNCALLKGEIDKLRPLPKNINIYDPICSDFASELKTLLDDMEKEDAKLAPSFAFIDPFGFGIPIDLVNRVLNFRACEVFINFMYRYIDMAMKNQVQENNMKMLFGTEEWRLLVNIEEPEERREQTCKLYVSQLNAKFISKIEMYGKHNQLKYILFHATNHSKGWWLMKEAIWYAIPDGSFRAYEKDRGEQFVLLKPEPDLTSFRAYVSEIFQGKNVHYGEIYNWMEDNRIMYLEKHLRSILKQLQKEGLVEFAEYKGKLGLNLEKNPLIRFH